jgi:hypothetical protein
VRRYRVESKFYRRPSTWSNCHAQECLCWFALLQGHRQQDSRRSAYNYRAFVRAESWLAAAQPGMAVPQEASITAGVGRAEGLSVSVEKKSSPEAWAARRRRSASQAPIAGAFSHRVSPSDLAHALPGIFASLQLSRRPIFHSVFRRTSRLSLALAGFRKCARGWGPFGPGPSAAIFSRTLPDAKSRPAWRKRIFFAPRPALAQRPRKHPTLLSRTASEPGGSLFALAYVCLYLDVAKSLWLIVVRNFARQIERQNPVAVLPAKNFEYDIFAMLQF